MIKYNSKLNRHDLAKETISNIDNYNQSVEDMISQGSMLLSNIQDPEGDDYNDRYSALKCADLIKCAYEEIKPLDDSYSLNDTLYNWTMVEDVNLFRYVPYDYIREIKSLSGKVFSNIMRDFTMIHKILVPFNSYRARIGLGRGMKLIKNSGFYYDDDYVMQRTIMSAHKSNEYTSTETNPKPQIPEFQNYKRIYHYPVPPPPRKPPRLCDYHGFFGWIRWTIDMIRYALTQYVPPKVPKDRIFYKDYKNDGTSVVTNLKSTKDIYNLYHNQLQLDFLGQLRTNINEIASGKIFYLRGKNKEDTERIYNSIPKNLFYRLSTYAEKVGERIEYETITVTDPETGETTTKTIEHRYPIYAYHEQYFSLRLTWKYFDKNYNKILDQYSKFYNKSNLVNYYVYDNPCYRDYYKDFNSGSVWVRYDFANVNIFDNNSAAREEYATPPATLDDEGYIKLCKQNKRELMDSISIAEREYDDATLTTRNEDFYSTKTYGDLRYLLGGMPINTVQQADSYVSYVNNTVSPWINYRIESIINHITDRDNLTKFSRLLTRRMTKNSGSVMVWYQSLLQFDSAYEKIFLTKEMAKGNMRHCLITKAYSANNDAIFNNYLYPNYIDIEEPDNLYYGERFRTGNTIYILNENFEEQKNIIVGINTIYIKVTDYNNIDVEKMENSGMIEDVTIKEIPVTRLMLKYPLPKWCHVDDTEGISIMRVKS